MGDKSPKATSKQSNQKQAKAAAGKQKAQQAAASKVKPKLAAHPLEGPDPKEALVTSAPAWFEDDWVDTPRFDWTLLRPGNVVQGPGIVEHPTTTLVVPPGRSARLDGYRTVWIEE